MPLVALKSPKVFQNARNSIWSTVSKVEVSCNSSYALPYWRRSLILSFHILVRSWSDDTSIKKLLFREIVKWADPREVLLADANLRCTTAMSPSEILLGYFTDASGLCQQSSSGDSGHARLLFQKFSAISSGLLRLQLPPLPRSYFRFLVGTFDFSFFIKCVTSKSVGDLSDDDNSRGGHGK